MELERLRCSSKTPKMDRRSYCIDCSLHGKNNPTPVQPCHFCYALTPEKVYGTAPSERFQNLQLFTLIMLLEDIYALVTKHHPTYFAQMEHLYKVVTTLVVVADSYLPISAIIRSIIILIRSGANPFDKI